VDKNGNLYVVDAGNNRVLRYPTPMAQQGQFPVPDLVIGQSNVTGYGPTTVRAPNAQGLYLSDGSTFLVSNLAFDASGNLWVIDTGNVRILRFNARLCRDRRRRQRDLELGRRASAVRTRHLSIPAPSAPTTRSTSSRPVGVGVRSQRNLFVGDFNRGMVFLPPFSNAMKAARLFGLYPQNYTFHRPRPSSNCSIKLSSTAPRRSSSSLAARKGWAWWIPPITAS